MNYEVREIPADWTRSLRHKVLWPHISEEKLCIIDIDHREDAIHLGVFHDDRLITVGSFFAMTTSKLSSQNVYRLRAMATHPDYRGKQSGRALIETAITLLRSKSVEILWCDARKNAVGFYEALGFNKSHEEYDIPQVGPHYFMWLELS